MCAGERDRRDGRGRQLGVAAADHGPSESAAGPQIDAGTREGLRPRQAAQVVQPRALGPAREVTGLEAAIGKNRQGWQRCREHRDANGCPYTTNHDLPPVEFPQFSQKYCFVQVRRLLYCIKTAMG